MRASLAPLVLGLVLASSPAAAQVDPCLADPLSCVGEVVTDVGDTVDDTVDEGTDIVDETADGVVGSVDDVVDPDGASPGPSSDGGGGDSPGRAEDRGARQGSTGAGSRGDADAGTADARRPREPARAAFRAPSAGDPERTVIQRLQRALTQGGEAFAFPLALLLLVGGFLLLQSKFDRSDPKLALAPVDTRDDVLPFS
jgi:hypothetical protein